MSGRETPETLLHTAARLRVEGRATEAIEAYRRLLALQPDLPDSWYNLALLERKTGQFEAALASYAQALAHGVRAPEEVRLNRGVIFADDLRRDDHAEAELNAALSLNPLYVPAMLNLGNLYEDRGRRAEAARMYRRALDADPNAALALARLAGLEPDDQIVARLKQAIGSAAIRPAERADLGFALGTALDRSGAYDEAFGVYAAAKAQSRRSAPPPAPRYDRQAHEGYIRRIIEAFPRSARAFPASPAPPPVFICGMFRSGSTLVEQMLGRHPQITPGGELPMLPEMVRTSLAPFPEAIAGLKPERLAELAAGYLARVTELFPGAGLVTDKRPDNFLYIGLIKTLFPDARIIHTMRDPLDTCLSNYFLHLDHGMSYALDLMDAGHWYVQYRRLMAHWAALWPGDIHSVGYDALVQDPKPAVEGLLEFLKLDWDDACLSPHQADNAVRTASVWQVREPLYQRSSGRWRHYERHVAPLKTYLAEAGFA